jgi:MFS family permease
MALNVKGKDGFYGWVNLVVMFLFNLALFPMMMAFSLVLPYWVKEFGWSRGLASGAQTVSLILSGLAAPAVAIFIMKKGSKKAIVVGNLMCIAGLILLAYQQHIWQLYLGIGVLLGLGVAIGGMLAMMTVTNNWFVMKRPVALALSMAAMGFSGIFINPSLMAMIEKLGWRNAYLIMAVLALLFCVIVPALFLVNKPEDLGQVPDGPVKAKIGEMKPGAMPHKNLYKTPVDFTAREALRTRTLWLLVIYGALQGFVGMGSGTHIIAYQFDIGISAITASLVGSVFSAVMGISQLGIGFLGLRIKMHTLAVSSMLLGLIGFSILLFAKSFSMMVVYAVVFGISMGIQFIAIGNLYPDYFGVSEFPKIMGYTMPFNTFVSALGAPVAGYIRDKTGSYVPAFRVLLVLLAISFFCILFAKPPVHPSLKGKVRGQEPEAQPVS